jgi:hypothetical protein
MYLYHAEDECLLGGEHVEILEKCLEKLPKTVTKDYYPYQLEVRTMPHNNPEDLIKEFEETLKLCREVFKKYKIEIKPASWLGGNENFNGVHFHFRNGARTNFQKTMYNMYPFVLSITDCFKNSVSSSNEVSRRFGNSNHIGFPALNNLSRRSFNEDRYRDIIVNGYTENTRHRLKSEPTIEVRTFDVPYNFEYFKNLTKLMYSLFNNINSEEEIKPAEDEVIKAALLETRQDIAVQRIGHNFLFDKSNKEVYEELCALFNIEKLVVPAVMRKDNNIKNQTQLMTNWRKVGTKTWLGEELLASYGDKGITHCSPRIPRMPSPPQEEINQDNHNEEEET